jgi:hypothetical protein
MLKCGRLLWDGHVARKGSEERSAQGILAEDLACEAVMPKIREKEGDVIKRELG